MLLKQFSHILENTKLTTSKFINDQYSSKNKVIKVSDVHSTVNDRYINSVSSLVNDAINNDEEDSTSDTNTNINIGDNGHLMLSFDQTQMQTHIMSKYLQILCDKYGIEESDILFDVSPIYKNNKLWLLYTFKFPKLQSSDSISINEFKEYIDQDDEYHIIGTVSNPVGSKIKVFISKSNEISSGPEMDAAMRTGAYTTWPSEFMNGEEFDIAVKYGCSVLFRAEFCNDVILLSVHNNIKINIVLEYNNSLENATNNVLIETNSILNNTTNYIYTDPEQVEKKYTYEHTDLQSVSVIITSMDKNTINLYGSDNLDLVLLEATASEEYNISDTSLKDWEVVASWPSSSIIKNNKNQYILNNFNLTTKLNSIPPKSAAFKYYKNTLVNDTTLNNYTTSLYLRPALKEKNGEIISNSIGNTITLNYVWKNTDAADITSLSGTGNRLVVCVKNTPQSGLSYINAPTEMEMAYIYNGQNNKTVPNFIIPVISNKVNYMSSDVWTTYNGYCDDTFNVRTAYCYNRNIYKQGNMSNVVSFTIDYISYYIDKEDPTYFYEQTLSLEDTNLNVSVETYTTGKDIYDIKHKKLIVTGVHINNLTSINIISEINKKYYRKDPATGELIIKDDSGIYTDDGIINNYEDVIGTIIRGTMLYDSNNEFKIDVNPLLLTSDYVVYLEDSNNKIIEDSLTNNNFVYNGYSSISADKFHLIQKTADSTTDTNNIAIQNIFPKDVHHVGIYTNDEYKMKMAQISFDGESKFVDNNEEEPLLCLGFLSDIHFDESTSNPKHKSESATDLENAYTYFIKHNIQDIYCAGDLSVSGTQGDFRDLDYFRDYLNNTLLQQQEIAAANTKLYIARGNHDIDCLYKLYQEEIQDIQNININNDPNNPVDTQNDESTNVFNEYDKQFLYVIDTHWTGYLQRNDAEDTIQTWKNTYYDTGIIDGEEIQKYFGQQIEYNENVAKATCGYNEYALPLEGGDNQLNLVIIGLPLYSGKFWRWSESRSPAYENEELYEFERLLNTKYQDNTVIIVITHLPFDGIHTGDYKETYTKGRMNEWYNSNQYKLLKKIHDSYEGVIWMHGHTHLKYEMQGEYTTINSYEGFFDNANVSCDNNVFDIHISSGAYPRIPKITYDDQGGQSVSLSDQYKDSQGLTMEVYKDHLIIKGIAFKTMINDNEYLSNKSIPIAMYRINFITNKKNVNHLIIDYCSSTNTITEHISPEETQDDPSQNNEEDIDN